ncbi:peptidoglycan-binding protein [Kribbella sp. NPDC058245]|uniref:peptidoglycan-binding domain-containing protein n=1 Tax=Kribbella sp. NPDC058245 TaxID=3346399 RepID=UPI0036E34AF7
MDYERDLRAQPTPAARRPDDGGPDHPMLDLQRKAGNRAVSTLENDAGRPGRRPNLGLGDKGAAVMVLQQLLSSQGVPLPVDGDFNATTEAAVIAFQMRHPELGAATGGVGAGTWAALDQGVAQAPAAVEPAATPAAVDGRPAEGAPLTDPGAPATRPSTINPPGVTTSSNLILQVETRWVEEHVGTWPAWAGAAVMALPRYVLRILANGNVVGLTVQAVALANEMVESGEWDALKAAGKPPYLTWALRCGLNATPVPALSDLLAPEITDLARRVLANYPHAGPTFEHYLAGSGTPKTYSMQEFHDQSSFKSVVHDYTPLDGTPYITTYNAKGGGADWEYTFGEIDYLCIQLVDKSDPARAKVRVTLNDPYQWHPDELRVSVPIHLALEVMKQHGAKEFMQYDDGKLVVTDLSDRLKH